MYCLIIILLCFPCARVGVHGKEVEVLTFPCGFSTVALSGQLWLAGQNTSDSYRQVPSCKEIHFLRGMAWQIKDIVPWYTGILRVCGYQNNRPQPVTGIS